VTAEEILKVIYEFGMRHDTNSVTGHPELKWQMHIRHGISQTTVYAATPKEVAEKAAAWIERKKNDAGSTPQGDRT